MGIPHLITYLRPYASPLLLSSETTSECHEKATAIIDGPALAYHAYYRALARRPTARNALEAAPSYAELGRTAVGWLDMLERHGVRIVRVFFDGALPESKKTIRLARLQAYLDQLTNFRSVYNTGLPAPIDDFQPGYRGPADFLSSQHVPAKLNALPASPFLVPAVIEALLSSRYGYATFVIPDEADTFCAHHAREEDGIIVTGDSDLLVHDLGLGGSVVFFKDLEFSEPTSDKTLVKGIKYDTAAIAKTIGLKSIMPLAFSLRQDYHHTFAECVQLARQVEEDDPDYAGFVREYAPNLLVLQPLGHYCDSNTLSETLKQLDPRISEYVHQMISQDVAAIGCQHLDMYLPFLIDDPARSSAWSYGRQVRQVGYFILSIVGKRTAGTKEYERRGRRIAETAIPHSNDPAISCTELTRILKPAREPYSDVGPVTSWRFTAAYLICTQLVTEGRSLPARGHLKSLISGSRASLSWEYIHLSAQLQAVLYSLRMVRQFSDVFFALYAAQAEHAGISAAVQALRRQLESLPRLEDLHPPATSEISDDAWDDVVSKLFTMLGVREEVFTQPPDKRKKKKRRKAADQNSVPQAASTQPPNNLYDLLAES